MPRLISFIVEGSDSDVEINGQTFTVSTPNAVLNHGRVLRIEDGPAGFAVIGMLIFPPDGKQTHYDTPLPQDSQMALSLTGCFSTVPVTRPVSSSTA